MPKLQKNGYTLIELLVAMSIMAILFTVGYASFREYSRRQVLASFVGKVKGDLSLAREMAVSGQKPDGVECNPPETLSGYNFRVISNESYVIEAICSGGTVEVKEVDVDSGLLLSVPANPIFFKVLSKGTNLSSDIEIVVSQESTGYTSSLFVTQSGEIK
ncbi:MAG: prepilin-type N-terminal cleavage/methylation domain-containing protein [Patescibacteria group bacterium]